MITRTITFDIDNAVGNKLYQLLQAMKDTFPLLKMEIKEDVEDCKNCYKEYTPTTVDYGFCSSTCEYLYKMFQIEKIRD